MTTSSPSIAVATPDSRPASRYGRLSTAVRQLRSRAAGGSLDRWLLITGGVLMPLGLLLILLGWLGASHTPLSFEQTPYLISGGILGLALTVAGGFVYFAYWQTIRIRDSRQQTEELAAALARIESLLAGGAGTTAVPGQRTGAAAFVATPNGSIFHRPDCTVVAGRKDLSSVDPDKTKLEPCRICEPLASVS